MSVFPKIQYPTFETKLVSIDKPVRFRPFLSKEQKIFLMALAGGDKNEMIQAVKQVVNNCILTEGVDVDKLPSFDLEHLFIALRSKSESNEITLRFKGIEGSDCTDCQKEKVVTINLDNIKVVTKDGHSKKISIDETSGIGVTMKYPQSNKLLDLIELRTTPNVSLLYEFIADCIDYIYDAEKVYEVTHENRKDAISWLESLSSTQFGKLQTFFLTMPHLEHRIDLSCKACGHQEEHVLEGLENFFG